MAGKKTETEVQLTEAQQKIWNDIKNLDVEWYGLPDQKVENICTPINIDPEKLFVNLKGPASLVTIEKALYQITTFGWDGKKVVKYVIEQKERFGLISLNPTIKLS